MPDEFHPNSYDAVLSRIETNTSVILERLEKGDARMNDLDKRTQKLENWRYYIVGFSAGIALLARAAWDWITHGGKH
jgi:hypothetical protein